MRTKPTPIDAPIQKKSLRLRSWWYAPIFIWLGLLAWAAEGTAAPLTVSLLPVDGAAVSLRVQIPAGEEPVLEWSGDIRPAPYRLVLDWSNASLGMNAALPTLPAAGFGPLRSMSLYKSGNHTRLELLLDQDVAPTFWRVGPAWILRLDPIGASAGPAVSMPPATRAETASPGAMRIASVAPRSTAAKPLAPEVLLLEMTVNGQRLPEVVHAEQLPGGPLLISVEGWIGARLAPLKQTVPMSDGTPAYPLDGLSGATHTIDRQNLSLLVTAPPSAFAGASISLQDPLAAPPPRPSPGLLLNYDMSLSQVNGSMSGGATLEGVLFSKLGNVVSSALVTDTGTERYATRLDTYWRYDLPQRMETLIVGDTLGVSGGWSRPVRFGGVRWGRDFGLRPGFVTLPQVSLAGAAALPSTVDVLVNNVLQSSQPVEPGPFDVSDLPITTGAGQIGLVVRDLLGRETVVQQSYYAAPELLAPGLSDFSFEAGWLRTGYGRDSTYGDAFGAATWRQGVSDSLTAEGRLEWQANRRAGGVSVASLLGTWAVGYVGLAASSGNTQGPSESGHLLQLGVQRSTQHGSGTVRYEQADRGFEPFGEAVGPLAAAERSRESWLASLGGSLRGPLSGAMSYVRQTRWNGERVQWLGMSLDYPLWRRANLNASVNKRLDGDQSWTAAIYIIFQLENGISTSAEINRGSDGEIDGSVRAQRNPPSGPGLGWRVEAGSAGGQHIEGGLQYNTNYLELGLQAVVDSDLSARVGARGTVGWFEKMLFASRPMGENSVAVVKVDGVAGVPVQRSNQIVAVTNARGLAFIADLLPWQANQIAIDPVDLPLDVEVAGTALEVTPYARSGVLVDFGAHRSRQALLVLRQPDGTPVPAGARVRLLPAGPEFMAGRRGEVWLTDLAEHRQSVQVSWAEGGCTLTLEVPASPDGTPGKIGPLDCAGAKP